MIDRRLDKSTQGAANPELKRLSDSEIVLGFRGALRDVYPHLVSLGAHCHELWGHITDSLFHFMVLRTFAAKYGIHVYLLDDTASIGGMMARLDKTFPTNDCSICIEAPQMYEVDNHPNIEIMTNTEVRKVKKIQNGFEVKLVKKARFIDEEKCTGCGACVEACPVNLAHEMDGRVGGERKLVYMPFPQAVPLKFNIDS